MSSSLSCRTDKSHRLAPLSPRQAASLGSATALFVLCLLTPAAVRAGPPEVIIRPARDQVPPLTAQERRRVQEAIDRGIVYLRRTQLPTGSWILGKEAVADDYSPPYFAAGFAGLGGLALLECGVPAGDPAVQAAARFVRLSGPRLFRTYDVALAVLLLDRLGDARDRPLLRSLALRLAAGQTPLGGWAYNCPLLNSTQEKRLEQALRKKTRADLPWLRPPPRAGAGPVSRRTTRTRSSRSWRWGPPAGTTCPWTSPSACWSSASAAPRTPQAGSMNGIPGACVVMAR